MEIEVKTQGNRGPAAVGILMNLNPKRENDTARGPFLGKGLPPGWG